jgi:hypothetical protein
MRRDLFSGLSHDLPPSVVRKPWWKVMSLWGWMLLLFATVATFAFFIGLISGETIFLPPVKSRSGDAVAASWNDSPVLYVLLMIGNVVVALGIWALFISWIRGRRDV